MALAVKSVLQKRLFSAATKISVSKRIATTSTLFALKSSNISNSKISNVSNKSTLLQTKNNNDLLLKFSTRLISSNRPRDIPKHQNPQHQASQQHDQHHKEHKTENQELSKSTQNEEDKKPEEPTSRWNVIGKFVKKYGPIGVVVHVSVSTMSTLIIYLALKRGVDVQNLLSYFTDKSLNSKGTTFALAFLLNKALEPIRLPITIIVTPILRRLLYPDEQEHKKAEIEQKDSHSHHNEKHHDNHGDKPAHH